MRPVASLLVAAADPDVGIAAGIPGTSAVAPLGAGSAAGAAFPVPDFPVAARDAGGAAAQLTRRRRRPA